MDDLKLIREALATVTNDLACEIESAGKDPALDKRITDAREAIAALDRIEKHEPVDGAFLNTEGAVTLCWRGQEETYSSFAARLYTTQPAPPVVPDGWLSADDMAELVTFYIHCEDSDADGYSNSKDVMRRLAELGVVRHCGSGRYQVTSFGCYLIDSHFEQKVKLPLQTIDEANEVSRLSMEARINRAAAPNWAEDQLTAAAAAPKPEASA